MIVQIRIELDDVARKTMLEELDFRPQAGSGGKITRKQVNNAINGYISCLTKHPTPIKQGLDAPKQVRITQESRKVPDLEQLSPIRGLRRVMFHVNNALFSLADALLISQAGEYGHVSDLMDAKEGVESLRDAMIKAHDAM